MLALMTRAMPASLLRQAGRSGFRRCDRLRCGPGRGGDRGCGSADLFPAAVSSTRTGHRSGFVEAPAFPGECPPPPSLASAIVSEGEDLKGLRESPQATNRAWPAGRRQTNPCQSRTHSEAIERRQFNDPDRRWRDRPISPAQSSRRRCRPQCRRVAARFRRERLRA